MNIKITAREWLALLNKQLTVYATVNIPGRILPARGINKLFSRNLKTDRIFVKHSKKIPHFPVT